MALGRVRAQDFAHGTADTAAVSEPAEGAVTLALLLTVSWVLIDSKGLRRMSQRLLEKLCICRLLRSD